MRIFFYAPFKPLGHPHPSGDLAIAKGLYAFLTGRGHQLYPAGALRARWIFWKPWLWPEIIRQRRRLVRRIQHVKPDLWLTYHTYYKAPDLLGPAVCRETGVPYVVFQGIYSTKRRRDLRTRPGFELNRRALAAAAHVCTNKREDHINLRRIIAPRNLSYIAPGIFPDGFSFDPDARSVLRRRWQAAGIPVILTAAMFRPGVKADGLAWVIDTCADLFRKRIRFHLVVAGAGAAEARLRRLARRLKPGTCHFAGKIPRGELYRYYSAADVFAFPGIRESLGMVYLEAQSCGLPVVAFDNGGVPEVVENGKTGMLTPPFDRGRYAGALECLLSDAGLRRQMGTAASAYVRRRHDLDKNYGRLEEILLQTVKGAGAGRITA